MSVFHNSTTQSLRIDSIKLSCKSVTFTGQTADHASEMHEQEFYEIIFERSLCVKDRLDLLHRHSPSTWAMIFLSSVIISCWPGICGMKFWFFEDSEGSLSPPVEAPCTRWIASSSVCSNRIWTTEKRIFRSVSAHRIVELRQVGQSWLNKLSSFEWFQNLKSCLIYSACWDSSWFMTFVQEQMLWPERRWNHVAHPLYLCLFGMF